MDLFKAAGVFVIVALLIGISGCTEPFFDDDDDDPDNDIFIPVGPGLRAKEYLQRENYTKLVVEIDIVAGMEPDVGAVNTMMDRLRTYCDKSSISEVISDTITLENTSYSPEDLVWLEDQYRDNYPDAKNKTAVLYILYLNGEMAESSATLGVTYRGSSMAIFKERIQGIAIPAWAAILGLEHEDFETSVMVHEMGHVLGLVNIGYTSEMDHEDAEHPHHSVHDDCVMYYAVETSAVLNIISTGNLRPPTTFHPDAVNDLQKLRSNEY